MALFFFYFLLASQPLYDFTVDLVAGGLEVNSLSLTDIQPYVSLVKNTGEIL